MQNLHITSPATLLPGNATAPIASDAATAGAPDSKDFSAVLAREIIGKALAHAADDAVLPVGTTAENQLPQPDAGIGPLQISPDASLVAPVLLGLIRGPGAWPAERVADDQSQVPGKALLASIPRPGGQSAERVAGDQPQLPGKALLALIPRPGGQSAERVAGDQPQLPGKALLALIPRPGDQSAERVAGDQPQLPGKALLASIPGPGSRSAERVAGDQPQASGAAPRDFSQNTFPDKPAWEPVGTADCAAPGKYLPPLAAADKTYRSGAGEPAAARLPDAAPLPQLNNPALAVSAFPAFAPASAVHNAKVDIRVGAPAWDGEFAHKVVWLATQHQQVAELHLNPPHLGPVEVMLTIGNDQGPQPQASAQFTSPHLAVREAIEAALPRLREMMADSGITLGNVTVSADSFQQQAGAGRQDRSPPKHHADDMAQTASGFAAQAGAALIRGGRDGLVDTFA